ncbi:hypothetical protein AHAS_Ahas11G0145000 [Arachis hypogaea]
MLLSVPPIAAVTSSYSAPPPLVPPIITVAHHHSHSLLPLLTVVPPLFTMSISRQALDSKVPTPASASPAAGTAPVGPATPIHSNRIDPSWKYIITIEEENTNETVCKFCGKIMKRGITREKEHLMIKLGNVAGCKMVPKDIIVKL